MLNHTLTCEQTETDAVGYNVNDNHLGNYKAKYMGCTLPCNLKLYHSLHASDPLIGTPEVMFDALILLFCGVLHGFSLMV